LVIGATNRVESLDPALRRVGRFDQEITLGIPDRDARSKILQIICKDLQLEQPFNFDEIATLTPGYVGADLLALAMRASSLNGFIKLNRSWPLSPVSIDHTNKNK
jgi:ribosome biogenesis ATPase